MTRLIVAEFITLDGVMQAPGFEEHRDGKNAWACVACQESGKLFEASSS